MLILFREGATALDLDGSARALDEAVSRAQSRLAGLRGPALQPGDREGEDGGAYRWHTRVEPLGAVPPVRGAREGAPYADGTALYAVSVELSWPGSRGPQHLRLETRRLGPAGVP